MALLGYDELIYNHENRLSASLKDYANISNEDGRELLCQAEMGISQSLV